MAFYALSERWKPVLAAILFWGLINEYIPANAAQILYSHLVLGSSVRQ